jgi:hypothetical protein
MVQVQMCQTDETVKYLGSPLGVRKFARLKFNNGVVGKVEGILNKIVTSGLKIAQVIHAIKSYVLPKLDYIMSNSVIGVMKFAELDGLIRKHLNNLIGDQSCRRICFIPLENPGDLESRT